MRPINLYFRKLPEADRWIYGDRYLIQIARRLIRTKKVSGVEKVFINLCKGFDELNIEYTINLPFRKIKPDEPVVVLGIGKYSLQGYQQSNRIIAGIGLMTHPAGWPDLCTDYPIAKYLQHSQWTKNIYTPYYGSDKCAIWPAGIDTAKWSPAKTVKKYDFLIYNKIMWSSSETEDELRLLILKKLTKLGLSYTEIIYGQYTETEYFNLLLQSKAMIFLCEHESQGFACCEALAMNVPIFAWDQGLWLDPNRFEWNDPIVPATSIPFFNENCGMAFTNYLDFEKNIDTFWNKVVGSMLQPRNYILENLTLKKSAQKMLSIIDEVYP